MTPVVLTCQSASLPLWRRACPRVLPDLAPPPGSTSTGCASPRKTQ